MSNKKMEKINKLILRNALSRTLPTANEVEVDDLKESEREIEKGYVLDPSHIWLMKIKDEKLKRILKDVLYTHRVDDDLKKLMHGKEIHGEWASISILRDILEVLELLNEDDKTRISFIGAPRGILLKLETKNIDVIIAPLAEEVEIMTWDMLHNIKEERLRAYVFLNPMPQNDMFKSPEEFIQKVYNLHGFIKTDNEKFKLWIQKLIIYFKREADAE